MLAASGSLATGCGQREELLGPATGMLRVLTRSSGEGLDPNGYTIMVGQDEGVPLGVNELLELPPTPPGSYSLRLTDVASNCHIAGEAARTVIVFEGDTSTVEFAVSCRVTTAGGTIVVTATTSETGGGVLDPDGYAVAVDSQPPVPIGRVDQLAFDGLAEGEHLLRLSGVARNCILAEENPQGVVVSSGDSARVNFTINCWPSPTGRIAFIRDGDIYTVRGDGTGLVNLSLEYANLGFPLESAEHLSWSPDGQRLAVSLVIGGIALIDGAMRFDTGPPEILEVEGGCVAWSPDGETLAFTNLLDELRTINLRTRAERTLFASSDTLSMMGCPAWSPDGARIAFPGARRNPTFVGDVVVLDAGGGPTSSLFGGFPGRLVTEISWGLEESHFAVVADFAIFLVPLPSHSAVLLLRNEFDPAEPTWAPDGRWLAFEEANRIFVIHPDGSGKTQLTFASVFEGLDSGPVWGRDP